jgi:hypothetical protein
LRRPSTRGRRSITSLERLMVHSSEGWETR